MMSNIIPVMDCIDTLWNIIPVGFNCELCCCYYSHSSLGSFCAVYYPPCAFFAIRLGFDRFCIFPFCIYPVCTILVSNFFTSYYLVPSSHDWHLICFLIRYFSWRWGETCRIQRIFSMENSYEFSKHFVYHASNNKQHLHTMQSSKLISRSNTGSNVLSSTTTATNKTRDQSLTTLMINPNIQFRDQRLVRVQNLWNDLNDAKFLAQS